MLSELTWNPQHGGRKFQAHWRGMIFRESIHLQNQPFKPQKPSIVSVLLVQLLPLSNTRISRFQSTQALDNYLQGV